MVQYGITYFECLTVYRTESSVWQNIIPIPYRISGIRSSVYRKFGMIVSDTVTVSCFRYTIPHFGIQYFCGTPNCDTTYRFTVFCGMAYRYTVFQKRILVFNYFKKSKITKPITIKSSSYIHSTIQINKTSTTKSKTNYKIMSTLSLFLATSLVNLTKNITYS